MAARKPLIAGNWKMFGRRAALGELAELGMRIEPAGGVDVVICPPAPYVTAACTVAAGGRVIVGAQDCSAFADDGARTGEVSAAMLADAGARYVIVGHSERRAFHGETNAQVRQKAQSALAAGLSPIICVGETLAERQAGKATQVVAGQMRESVPAANAEVVVAYEPVWAIGAQVTPSLAEIAEVHAVISRTLADGFGEAARAVRILYGGSVNPANAAQIFAVEGVDGALVGRASLKAADFAAIILAHPAAR